MTLPAATSLPAPGSPPPPPCIGQAEAVSDRTGAAPGPGAPALTEAQRAQFDGLLLAGESLLLRLAHKSMGSRLRGKHDERDVVQETAMRVLQAIQRGHHGLLASEAQFMVFAARVLQNVIRDLQDRHARGRRDMWREVSIEEIRWAEELCAASTVSPSRAFARQENKAALQSAMRELHPVDCAIVTGHAVHDRTFVDLGQDLRMSQHVVRRRFYQMLVHLQAFLGGRAGRAG